jgi:hypothetical protein
MLNIFETLKRKQPELPPALEPLRPHLQELNEQNDAERTKKQTQLLGEFKALIAARDQALPALEAAVLTAEVNKTAAAGANKVAERALNNAKRDQSAAVFDYGLKISQLEHEIRLQAPEVIDEFICELLAESDRTRLKVRESERRSTPNWRSGKRKIVVTTNAPTVEKRVAAIREAIERANLLKLEALPIEEIVARLQALQESLPEISDTEIIVDPVDVSELYRP